MSKAQFFRVIGNGTTSGGGIKHLFPIGAIVEVVDDNEDYFNGVISDNGEGVICKQFVSPKHIQELPEGTRLFRVTDGRRCGMPFPAGSIVEYAGGHFEADFTAQGIDYRGEKVLRGMFYSEVEEITPEAPAPVLVEDVAPAVNTTGVIFKVGDKVKITQTGYHIFPLGAIVTVVNGNMTNVSDIFCEAKINGRLVKQFVKVSQAEKYEEPVKAEAPAPTKREHKYKAGDVLTVIGGCSSANDDYIGIHDFELFTSVSVSKCLTSEAGAPYYEVRDVSNSLNWWYVHEDDLAPAEVSTTDKITAKTQAPTDKITSEELELLDILGERAIVENEKDRLLVVSAMALQGLCSNPHYTQYLDSKHDNAYKECEVMTTSAIELAELLIKKIYNN